MVSANSFVKEDVALVYPTINVNSFRVLEEDKGREFQKRLADLEALIRGRNHFGFWETFTKLLAENEKLRIGLIHGNSAQVWQDFIIGFRGAAGKYADRVEFARFESSLLDGELAKTIEKAANSGVHAVFLLRGPGLENKGKFCYNYPHEKGVSFSPVFTYRMPSFKRVPIQRHPKV